MRKSETLFCSLRDFPSVKIYEFKASIFIQSYVQQYSKNKNKIEIVGSAIKLQICISLTLKKKRCIVSFNNIAHRMKLMLLIFLYSLYRYVIKKIILSKTRNFFLLFHHRVCKNQEVHTVYMWCWESRYFPINSSSQILVTPTIVHRREQWAPNYQEAKERDRNSISFVGNCFCPPLFLSSSSAGRTLGNLRLLQPTSRLKISESGHFIPAGRCPDGQKSRSSKARSPYGQKSDLMV